jgi:hypothetical protein
MKRPSQPARCAGDPDNPARRAYHQQ